MTRPTDSAIARAFYDAMQLSAERAPQYQVAYNYIIDRAAEFDAESPAGTSPVSACWCQTCRPQTMTDMRFIVCPDCGNKRFPRANFHEQSFPPIHRTGFRCGDRCTRNAAQDAGWRGMMIPHSYAASHEHAMRTMAARQQAEIEVRQKFPRLIVGSSGWHRAVNNRRNRIMRKKL